MILKGIMKEYAFDVNLVKQRKERKKEKRNLSKKANVTEEKHSSQALVSSIILLSRSLASSGPFSRNERQPALLQGFRLERKKLCSCGYLLFNLGTKEITNLFS